MRNNERLKKEIKHFLKCYDKELKCFPTSKEIEKRMNEENYCIGSGLDDIRRDINSNMNQLNEIVIRIELTKEAIKKARSEK